MKKIIIIIALIFILFGTITVNADTGPKPSITIYLENMDTTEYTLDLLTKPEPKYQEGFYYSISESEYINEPIYKYNKGGWMATSIRDFWLWGNIEGNSEKRHRFTYWGVPDEFKVIIQYKDGTIKTSDVIQRTEFDFVMHLDVNTMKVEHVFAFNLSDIIICITITLILEILIALIMRIRNIKVIIFANLITQILIQSLRLFNFTNYILPFIILELIIFFIEYVIYKKLFKDVDSKKILQYTIIANAATAILTFFNISALIF